LTNFQTFCGYFSRWLLILDTPEHVDSENIKLKIGPRPLFYQSFSKYDLKIHKMWLKLAKISKN
jgi:hypothetical protein